MRKLYSQLIGLPIFLTREQILFRRVLDLVLDPDKGSLVAIQTTSGTFVSPADLGPFEEGLWRVADRNSFVPEADLVRLRQIPKPKRSILGKPVFTRSGHYLGYLADYVMDMDTFSLVQLYVKRTFFLFLTLEKRILSWKDVEEITDKAIIVSGHHGASAQVLEEFFRLKRHGAPLAGRSATAREN